MVPGDNLKVCKSFTFRNTAYGSFCFNASMLGLIYGWCAPCKNEVLNLENLIITVYFEN